MTRITTDGISRDFGKTTVLDKVRLEVNPGELFFLLGPSGCGKSTLLRIIAGLLAPTAGRILFNGEDVTDRPTDLRNAVMCFQSYALWPHMSVRQNVSFGLEVRKVAGLAREKRIDEVLDLVRMRDLANRKPNELSGGQQQRVALARALAVNPACLLLDEPLSNLDAKLRLEMRGEIRRICKESGFTTIYVTHDQKEALAVADRIAILTDGKLMQVGTAQELYLRPGSTFVAEFIGQTNLIEGIIHTQDAQGMVITTPIGMIRACGVNLAKGTQVKLSIRPEHLRIDDPMARDTLAARVTESTFLGENSEHILQSGSIQLKAICSPPILKPQGQVRLSVAPEHVSVLVG